MKYAITFLAVLFTISSSAQDCTETSLVQKPGAWKPGMKGSEGGTAADLAKEKKLVTTIHSMIKSKYTPKSVEAIFHGAYNGPYPNMPANSYYYSIIPLNYYCQSGTVKTAGETSTYFQIAANMLDAEIYDRPDAVDVSSTGYHYIPDMPVEKDGYFYFKEIDAGLGFGMKGKSSSWLITYDGKLPFTYVTKKEFIEKRKGLLSNGLPLALANFKESLKMKDKERSMMEVQYKNDPEKLKFWMKMDYQSVKDNIEKNILKTEKDYKMALAKIEIQLTGLPAELNQQAIVKSDPGDYLSFLFTDDNDGSGKVLIKPNPGYFKKLPRSSPQFFWVYVRANHKEPIATNFMTEIMKAVDFTILKNMLGK